MRRPAGEPRNRRAVRRRRWSTTAAPTSRRARAPRWRRGVVPPLGPPLSLPSPFAPLVARAASSPRVVPSLSPCGLAASSSQGSHRHRACHAPPAAAASLEPTMRVPRSSPPLALPPCPHLTCTPSRHARSDAPPVCRAPRAPTISSRRPRRAAANDHSPSASRDALSTATRQGAVGAPAAHSLPRLPPAPVRRRCGTRGLLRTRGADRRPGRASSRRTRDTETAAGGFIVLGSATRAIKQAGSHRQGQFPFTRRVRERHESQQP